MTTIERLRADAPDRVGECDARIGFLTKRVVSRRRRAVFTPPYGMNLLTLCLPSRACLSEPPSPPRSTGQERAISLDLQQAHLGRLGLRSLSGRCVALRRPDQIRACRRVRSPRALDATDQPIRRGLSPSCVGICFPVTRQARWPTVRARGRATGAEGRLPGGARVQLKAFLCVRSPAEPGSAAWSRECVAATEVATAICGERTTNSAPSRRRRRLTPSRRDWPRRLH